ncbi:MAG: hypothetical protein D6782_12335 [Alphaproteobacteria bacterium]|nr:MAG: hypothetical protein D6782_12335 [Alphaproteobacteria bacterium]
MRLRMLAAATLVAAGLGACGSSGKKAKLSPEQLGPQTAEQIKHLPRGLIGDSENASHSYETLGGDER